MRAVVDTNVWVSAVLKPAGNCAKVLAAYRAGAFDLVISDPLLEELATTLARPRFAEVFGVTPEEIEAMIGLLEERALRTGVSGTAHGCRDPKDDVVIETALRGVAVRILSGDKDLTDDDELAGYLARGGVRVATVTEFLEELADPA